MREMLITKPDIGLHKTFFSVSRMHQGFAGHSFSMSSRILSFAEQIMEKYNSVRSYDFDFSSFVFLERLLAQSEQEEQAQRRADEIRQALTVWNVFEQQMHLSVWNSTNQAYHRAMNLISRYGGFYPRFFAGDVQIQRRTSVLNRYNTTPYVASRTFHNVMQHLQSGNQTEPAGERIKHDFERQMLFFSYVQEMQHPYVIPYSLVLTELYAERHTDEDRPAYHLSATALEQAYEGVEAAVETFLKPEWQEQLSITRRQVLNVDKALSDLIYEKQMAHMLLQQLDTEFEHLDSTVIWEQWESHKENVHSRETQIDRLVSLKQYMETISRKPLMLITNDDIDNVATVENAMAHLEDNLIYRVWAYSDIAEAARTMWERRFESSEDEKAFFIDSIKKHSTAIMQNQNTERIVESFTEYVDLETFVAVIQRYSLQEWQEFKEKISHVQDLNIINESVIFDDIAEVIQMIEHRAGLETVDEIYGNSMQSVDEYFEYIIQERKAMASLFEYLDIQMKQQNFENYEEEKALFADIVRDYKVAYDLSDNLVFSVQQFTSQEWQDFKENISHARVHEEYLTDLKKYITSTIHQTESEDRKQWDAIDEIFEQQQHILRNEHVPIADIRKVLSSLNIDSFSIWVNDFEELVNRHEIVSAAVKKYEEFASIHKYEDFEIYKNYFIQCMDECRTEKRQLFLTDRSKRQIERVFQSGESRRIYRLLNINELPQEVVEFESIPEIMLDSIRRYDRTQWNKLIADIDGYYNTLASPVFETAKKSVPILRSALNVQVAFSDIMKIVHNIGGLHKINVDDDGDSNDSNEIMQTVAKILRTYAPDVDTKEVDLLYEEPNVYLRNQNMVRQILSEQTAVFLENLRELVRQQTEVIHPVEKAGQQPAIIQLLDGQSRWASQASADAYRQVQHYVHIGTKLQEQDSPVYQQNVKTDQEQSTRIHWQNVQMSQEQRKPRISVLTDYLTQSQSDSISYEASGRMVLKEELADRSDLTLDADSVFRSGTGQEMMRLAPSVKQGKEKLKEQELELERISIALRENKTKVDELTKEQLKLIQLIQKQGEAIEQIGTGGTVESMMMNRLQSEMRIERLRRGIR